MMQKNRISFQTKNYKVILNLIQDLPYKLFCKKQFNNKNQRLTRKIPNQVWNDFYDITARGFTLIELLVVVLIIGILAAVALPQYQIAVQKAKFSKLRLMAESLKKSVFSYHLANNDWPSSLDDLDITFQANDTDASNCKQKNDMYCCIESPRPNSSYGEIICGQMDYTFGYAVLYADSDGTPFNQSRCIERENITLCRALRGGTPNNASASLLTPTGFLSNARMYIID